MLDGKLEIAADLLSHAAQVPGDEAHEMISFMRGLVTPHGTLGYEMLTVSMCRLGLEVWAISQAMKKSIRYRLDVQSAGFYQRARRRSSILCGGVISTPMSDGAAAYQTCQTERQRVGSALQQHSPLAIQIAKRRFGSRRDVEWVSSASTVDFT